MTWFSTLFRRKKGRATAGRDHLSLQARITELESDMLELRSSDEKMHLILKRLQGKMYRGVALGETMDNPANPAAPPPNGSGGTRARPTPQSRESQG